MKHEWEQIKHNDRIVIAWKCKNCGYCAGRYYGNWPEDRPPANHPAGEECKKEDLGH